MKVRSLKKGGINANRIYNAAETGEQKAYAWACRNFALIWQCPGNWVWIKEQTDMPEKPLNIYYQGKLTGFLWLSGKLA